jgi:GT2 family glycosyltransferase
MLKTEEPMSRSGTAEKLTALNGWRVEKTKAGGLADCCLIVATYLRPAELLELLQCLSQIDDGPVEVVIVDGAPGGLSESGIRNWVREIDLPFELIYVRGPKGLTLQRNVGIDLCTKPYVFFLDDDSLPLAGYFQQVRQVLADQTGAPVGAVGACVMNEIDKPLPRRWQLRRALGLVPNCEPFIYSQAGTSVPTGVLKPFRGIRDVDIFPGSAFAVRV